MGGKERILWADGDPEWYEDLFTALAKKGHEVIATADSIGKVKALIDEGLEPTLAIVDSQMHGVRDGYRIANLLRKRLPAVKIIYFSKSQKAWGNLKWDKSRSTESMVSDIDNI